MTSLRHPTPDPAAVRRPVDGATLRAACGAFATGVTVVTTGSPGEPAGMTVNSFTSVSLDPPLVLICLHRDVRLAPLLRRSGGFVINILTHRQQHVARAFARRTTARLADLPHEYTVEGLPVLGEALGHLVCRLVDEHQGGDHTIVVGEVVEVNAHRRAEEPLVFYHGAMHALRELAE